MFVYVDVINWWDNGSDQIVFGWGSSGYVVINVSEQCFNKMLLIFLLEGWYCNVLIGGLDIKKLQCIGGEIVIDDVG